MVPLCNKAPTQDAMFPTSSRPEWCRPLCSRPHADSISIMLLTLTYMPKCMATHHASSQSTCMHACMDACACEACGMTVLIANFSKKALTCSFSANTLFRLIHWWNKGCVGKPDSFACMKHDPSIESSPQGCGHRSLNRCAPPAHV